MTTITPTRDAINEAIPKLLQALRDQSTGPKTGPTIEMAVRLMAQVMPPMLLAMAEELDREADEIQLLLAMEQTLANCMVSFARSVASAGHLDTELAAALFCKGVAERTMQIIDEGPTRPGRITQPVKRRHRAEGNA